MKFNPYKNIFIHPLWLDKRAAVFKRDGHQCVNCGFPNKDKRRYRYGDKKERRLEIHFKQFQFDMKRNRYLEPWKYDVNLLLTMDNWCIEKLFRLWDIPVKKINQ